MKNFFKKTWPVINKKRFIVPTSIIFLLILIYAAFINHTEPTEIGIARNMVTGKMWIQEEGGFHITPPWVWVTCVPTHPVRVAVMSSGRGYSAKLVQFEKRHWKEFVALEGWRWYWFDNRFSINFSYDEEYRGIKDILRGYAYSPKQYPFLVILEEYREER